MTEVTDDVAELSETEADEPLVVTRTNGCSAPTVSAGKLLEPQARSGQQPPEAGRDIHLHCRCSERFCCSALLCLLLLLGSGAALLLWPNLLTSFLSLRLLASTPPTPSPTPVPTATLYSRYQAVCEAAGVNSVLNRDDHAGVERDPLRDWSVSSLTFLQQTELPVCASPQQLLQAVNKGQRRPVPGYDFVNLSAVNASNAAQLAQARRRASPEWSRSYFLTAGCRLRWLTGERLCDVLASFSHVLFVGDSLLRHLTQALFMLITEDLQYGALPRFSYSNGMYDVCRCDGQYSEHAVCRSFNPESMFALRDPRVYGVCTASTTSHRFQFVYHQTPPQAPVLDLRGYCNADSRPRVLVFQAGSHFSLNSSATFSGFTLPILRQIRALQSNCSQPQRWFLLWLALPAQSRLLDPQYPHQSREQARLFNAAMGGLLAEQQVSVLDHWNLTVNAATSDGFHYLSDVILDRANHVANLLSLWSET